MRNRYWAMLHEIKYYQHYYDRYKDIAERRELWFGILSGAVTIFCFIGLALWQQYALVMSLIIVAVQVGGIIRPYLPFSQQVASLRYLVPEIIRLVQAIDHNWLSIEEYSDDDIRQLIIKFENRWQFLRAKYVDCIPIPNINRCCEWGEKEANQFFQRHYSRLEPNMENNNPPAPPKPITPPGPPQTSSLREPPIPPSPPAPTSQEP